MWIVVLIFAMTFAVSAVLMRPRQEDGPQADDGRAASARSSAPESLEGVLVAQLAATEITRAQYTRAMEKLAARDDERHPLSVPPEVGGAA